MVFGTSSRGSFLVADWPRVNLFYKRKNDGEDRKQGIFRKLFYFALEVASSWRIAETSWLQMGLLFFLWELGALWWGDDALHCTWTSWNQEISEEPTCPISFFKVCAICIIFYFLVTHLPRLRLLWRNVSFLRFLSSNLRAGPADSHLTFRRYEEKCHNISRNCGIFPHIAETSDRSNCFIFVCFSQRQRQDCWGSSLKCRPKILASSSSIYLSENQFFIPCALLFASPQAYICYAYIRNSGISRVVL